MWSPILSGRLRSAELAAHPHDAVAAHLSSWARNLSVGTQHFVALYLLSHGAVKLWVIIGLMRERLWYYPVALGRCSRFSSSIRYTDTR